MKSTNAEFILHGLKMKANALSAASALQCVQTLPYSQQKNHAKKETAENDHSYN